MEKLPFMATFGIPKELVLTLKYYNDKRYV